MRFSDNSNARLWPEVEWIVGVLCKSFEYRNTMVILPLSISKKLHLDFGDIPSIGQPMDESKLRGLFTEIGCIMEDASVTALVWQRDDARSRSDRAAELRGAYNKIGALLDTIDAKVR